MLCERNGWWRWRRETRRCDSVPTFEAAAVSTATALRLPLSLRDAQLQFRSAFALSLLGMQARVRWMWSMPHRRIATKPGGVPSCIPRLTPRPSCQTASSRVVFRLIVVSSASSRAPHVSSKCSFVAALGLRRIGHMFRVTLSPPVMVVEASKRMPCSSPDFLTASVVG